MDDNGIMDVKNSVGTGFGLGKDVLYALATTLMLSFAGTVSSNDKYSFIET